MKKLITVFFLTLAFSVAGFAHEDQIEKARNVLSEIMRTPDRAIPRHVFDRAVCVGIVPSELKAAFVVGGTYGRGVLVCRRHGDGPWGAPLKFTLGEGSFGFQIGGESTDVVFVVMNESGARKLTADHVKLGADISIAAGPVGRSGEGATDAELHAEILSYSRTRGLFAGVSLSGAVFKTDHDANRALYGRDITSRQILFGGEATIPPEAAALDRELARYSPRGGHRWEEKERASAESHSNSH